jgi:hypothetical protein
MDDITSAATRRMTYAELGRARGITTGSAEQLARRRRWPRQLSNDGMVRVLVPVGEDRMPRRHKGPTKAPDIGEAIGGYERPVSSPLHQGPMISPDIGEVIGQAIREAVTPLAAQLEHERARADRAEQRASDAERIARDEVAALQAELVEVRVSERAASERAAATAAESTELRRLLDVADRRIQGERTRAEQERELRTQAQGRLADKDATITGLVAEKQVLKQEVETLTELVRARRSWWQRVFG